MRTAGSFPLAVGKVAQAISGVNNIVSRADFGRESPPPRPGKQERRRRPKGWEALLWHGLAAAVI